MYETSDFLLCNNIYIYQVLCTLIYRRRSLYSFLSKIDGEIIAEVTSSKFLGVIIDEKFIEMTLSNACITHLYILI